MSISAPQATPLLIVPSADVFERVCLAQNLAYFEWLPDTGEIRFSEEMNALFGSRLECWTRQTTREYLHPDDLPGFDHELKVLLKGPGARGELRFRAGVPGRGYRWFRLQLLLERNAEGWAIRVTGAASDIHDQVEREAENRALLARQAASAAVIQAISDSPGDPKPAFALIVRHVRELAGTSAASILRYDGERLHRTADAGFRPDILAALRAGFPRAPGPDSVAGRVVLANDVVQVADLAAEPGVFAPARSMGVRSCLGIPLRREGRVVGVLDLGRTDIGAFEPEVVALAQSFADQAVIAMETARLLGELRERTAELAARNDDYSEQVLHQSAAIDVLQAMSGSPGDPQPVFARIAERAREICDGEAVTMFQFDGTLIHARYSAVGPHHVDPAAVGAFRRAYPMPPSRLTTAGRVILDREMLHLRDMDTDPTILPSLRALGYRSQIAMPLLRGEETVGAIILSARRPGGFTDKQIELMQTFAEQAVIAVGSAETYRALQSRTEELGRSLDELRRTQGQLVQTEKLAWLGQLTAGIAHEIKNPLNFVNNFSEVSVELLAELREAVAPGRTELDAALRAEIDDLTETLRGNLEKIVHHGRRADSIVKNMLLHSRTGVSEHRPINLNALAEEALNLAYHGARAGMAGFNITLEKSLDPAAGQVDVYPQEFTRVLLNLIGNGFDAVRKRAEGGATPGFEPMLRLTTRDLGEQVEIRVRDNGTGMTEAVREQIFQPFFTTKPAGEGTGLGLSIGHDIIVKQHGGRLSVESAVDAFTEFVITLPRVLNTEGKARHDGENPGCR